MELVSYKDFSKLRLANFLPPKKKVVKSMGLECSSSRCADYLEMCGWCFFVFADKTAKEVVEISIDLADDEFPVESGARILEAIGLPLAFGMTSREIVDVLGPPEWGKGAVFMRHRVGTKHPYRIGCHAPPKKGLQRIWVVREDYFLDVH